MLNTHPNQHTFSATSILRGCWFALPLDLHVPQRVHSTSSLQQKRSFGGEKLADSVLVLSLEISQNDLFFILTAFASVAVGSGGRLAACDGKVLRQQGYTPPCVCMQSCSDAIGQLPEDLSSSTATASDVTSSNRAISR